MGDFARLHMRGDTFDGLGGNGGVYEGSGELFSPPLVKSYFWDYNRHSGQRSPANPNPHNLPRLQNTPSAPTARKAQTPPRPLRLSRL